MLRAVPTLELAGDCRPCRLPAQDHAQQLPPLETGSKADSCSEDAPPHSPPSDGGGALAGSSPSAPSSPPSGQIPSSSSPRSEPLAPDFPLPPSQALPESAVHSSAQSESTFSSILVEAPAILPAESSAPPLPEPVATPSPAPVSCSDSPYLLSPDEERHLAPTPSLAEVSEVPEQGRGGEGGGAESSSSATKNSHPPLTTTPLNSAGNKAASLQPGDRCTISFAERPGNSLPCEVLAVENDKCYVHYVNFDARWDEWVETRSLTRMDPRDVIDSVEHPPLKRSRDSGHHQHSPEGGEDRAKIWRHAAGHGDEHTKIRNVQQVQLGPFLMDAWYFSPYPVACDHRVDVLYVCEKTFKYATSSGAFRNHHPPASYPGVEQYRDSKFIVHRIDGSAHRLFCQNLSLLGKLFIEHKTLHYDPSPFDFFLILEADGDALRPVGYFSKEKVSQLNYNLACIVTFPPHQRKGVGKFIISLSYELSKREGKVGSPEKPLSDLGKRSYRSFWSCRLLMLLRDACESGARPTVQTLSQDTGIRIEDVMSTLQFLGFIKHLRGTFVLAVSAEKVATHLTPYLQRSFAAGFCDPSRIV